MSVFVCRFYKNSQTINAKQIYSENVGVVKPDADYAEIGLSYFP
jgi:hypothetical protein